MLLAKAPLRGASLRASDSCRRELLVAARQRLESGALDDVEVFRAAAARLLGA